MSKIYEVFFVFFDYLCSINRTVMRIIMNVCVSKHIGSQVECPYRVLGSDVRLIVYYVNRDIKAYSYRLYSLSVLEDKLYQRLCSDSSIRSVDVITYREDCILSVYRS